jgi:hypothetical protein
MSQEEAARSLSSWRWPGNEPRAKPSTEYSAGALAHAYGLFSGHPRSGLSLGNVLDGLREGVVCLRDLRIALLLALERAMRRLRLVPAFLLAHALVIEAPRL